MMNPYDFEINDIFNVFFNTMSGSSNMKYFNAQGLACEHRMEEQVINCALHCEQVVDLDDSDGDPALNDLQRQ